MKRKVTAVLVLIAACLTAFCGCSDKDNDKSSDSASSQSEVERFNTDGFETVVSENTFSWLDDYFVNSSHESVYVATFSCTKPEGAEDGVYGCENLSVVVDGEEARQSLCYLLVNGNTAAINISFFDDYVKKGTVIEIDAENFNELNPVPEGETQDDYTDISDVTAFEGKLGMTVTAAEGFGYLLFEEVEGCESVTVSDKALQFSGALELFGGEPDKEKVKIVLEDGSEISFDRSYVFHRVDEEGNDLEEFDAMFDFSDENKSIDLSQVSRIVVNGQDIT